MKFTNKSLNTDTLNTHLIFYKFLKVIYEIYDKSFYNLRNWN